MVNNLCYSIECRFVRQQELQGCGFLVLMMYKTNRNRVKGQGSFGDKSRVDLKGWMFFLALRNLQEG